MKVKCPGCRAEPRMVGVTDGSDGEHLHYRCFYRGCRYYGKEIAEQVRPKKTDAEEKQD